MKRKKLNVKLDLNKESISNLNNIKGGDSTQTKFVASECICVETDTCPTHCDPCCTAGTSKIICC